MDKREPDTHVERESDGRVWCPKKEALDAANACVSRHVSVCSL